VNPSSTTRTRAPTVKTKTEGDVDSEDGRQRSALGPDSDLMAAAATTMSITCMAASVVLACGGLTKLASRRRESGHVIPRQTAHYVALLPKSEGAIGARRWRAADRW